MESSELAPPGDYTYARLEYRWVCNACKRQHVEVYSMLPGLAVPRPAPLPAGWRNVNRQLICERHSVFVVALVDGTPLETYGN